MILVTGGGGFVGSNFVLNWLARCNEPVVNLDKLTYAASLGNLYSLRDDTRHMFVHGDIGDVALLNALLEKHRPRAIVHFAAETHVDQSIRAPAAFIETNVNGTFALLQATLSYWSALKREHKTAFRFLHVSTDEVYGSLSQNDPPFSEATAYAPNNPYAASKAASDHLVRAYHHSYGLPTLTTHCSNNYGPYQFPEKLIPLVITRALAGESLPVYGDGLQVRDWLYVGDHCVALRRVLQAGIPGQTYNIGAGSEKTNLDVVRALCDLLDDLAPAAHGDSYRRQIVHVVDRPGHDRRYAIDARKIQRELAWMPVESFEGGLRKTVQWYLDNPTWIRHVQSGAYLHGRGIAAHPGHAGQIKL